MPDAGIWEQYPSIGPVLFGNSRIKFESSVAVSHLRMDRHMAQRLRPRIVLASLVFAAFSVFSESAAAQAIWSGLTKSFSKASLADPTLPANQDVLTANVKLTRASFGGMFNIAS